MKAKIPQQCFDLEPFRCDQFTYMTYDMVPDPGPELDTVYIPGHPGAGWSEHEIATTRSRILQVSRANNQKQFVSSVLGHSSTLGCY